MWWEYVGCGWMCGVWVCVYMWGVGRVWWWLELISIKIFRPWYTTMYFCIVNNNCMLHLQNVRSHPDFLSENHQRSFHFANPFNNLNQHQWGFKQINSITLPNMHDSFKANIMYDYKIDQNVDVNVDLPSPIHQWRYQNIYSIKCKFMYNILRLAHSIDQMSI